MRRESRDEYILRKMHEGRMEIIESITPNFSKSSDNLDILTEENKILKHNVKELQEQLQNAYKRIAELQPNNDEQMELDV